MIGKISTTPNKYESCMKLDFTNRQIVIIDNDPWYYKLYMNVINWLKYGKLSNTSDIDPQGFDSYEDYTDNDLEYEYHEDWK